MNSTLEKAIRKFGPEMQKNVAIEEMSELIKEICKDKRGNKDRIHLAEEIADVEIMIEQLKMIYNVSELVAVQREKKLKRLEERMREF